MRFKYSGLRELKHLLRQLPDSAAKSVIWRSMRKAAVPIKTAIETRVPRDSGVLARSIAVSPRLSAKQRPKHQKMGMNDIEMYVGVAAGQASAYAHILEFGSSKLAPEPFMTPAFEASKQEAFDILITETWNNIEKKIKTLRRQGKWID